MSYDAMSAAELRSSAEQRYQQSRQRLMGLMESRRQYAQELQSKYDAEMAQQQADLEGQQREAGHNWLQGAGMGAQLGMAGGPWGALIGGGLGAVAGIAQSAQGYAKEGHGRWGSIGQALIHPAGEKFEWQKDIPLGPIAGVVGGLAAQGATPAKGGTMAGAEASQAQGLADWRRATEAAHNAQASADMAGSAGGPTFGTTGSDMSAAFESPNSFNRPKVPPAY